MTRENRIFFLDLLRVAATCAVVMLHTISGAMDYSTLEVYSFENRFSNVMLDLVSWCVPVFLMISGYLFLNPGRQLTYKDIITKYCRRVVLALFLFGVPYACMELIVTSHGFRPVMLVKAVWMVLCGKSWAHMWYLYLILLFYLITPVLRFALERIPKWLVWGICFLLFLGCSVFLFIEKTWNLQLFPTIPEAGIYLFYYICGYLFRTLNEKNEKKFFFLFSVMAIMAAGCSLYMRTAGNLLFRTVYAYPVTLVLSVSLFGLCSCRNRKIKNTGILEKVSAYSFTIYLIHPVFINFYYKFLKVSIYDYPLLWSLPVFFLAVMIPSVIGSKVLWGIKPLRKWVL